MVGLFLQVTDCKQDFLLPDGLMRRKDDTHTNSGSATAAAAAGTVTTSSSAGSSPVVVPSTNMKPKSRSVNSETKVHTWVVILISL